MTAQADAPRVLREVAETSAAQAKENFEKLSAAAGDAANLLKNGYAATLKGTQDYSAKVLEFAQTNINAAGRARHKTVERQVTDGIFRAVQRVCKAAIRNIDQAGSGTRCTRSENDHHERSLGGRCGKIGHRIR
jgi:hypothetical protein